MLVEHKPDMISIDDSPLFSIKDICEGISREQGRWKQLCRGDSILSARNRVLSATSRTNDSTSYRSWSRVSSARHQSAIEPAFSQRTSRSHISSKASIKDMTDRSNEHTETDRSTASNYVIAQETEQKEVNGDEEEEEEEDVSNKQLVPVNVDEDDLSRPETPDVGSDCDASSFHSGGAASMRVSEDDLTKLNYLQDSENPLMRSYTSLNGVPVVPAKSMCIRAKSAVQRKSSGSGGGGVMVRSLSRQCCDVLGPKVCHECALLKRRMHESTRHEISLSRLHVSERNFADRIVLKKALPHLSTNEIEDRVVSGDISRLPLRERIYERKARLSRESNRSTSSLISTAKSAPGDLARKKGTSSSFFMNIQDLNCKVLLGRVPLDNRTRESLLRSQSSLYSMQSIDANRSSFSELTYKSSINTATPPPSRSQSARILQPYEPPLVPKVCQNPQPSFFAGREGTYKLPDRLPDQAVAGQVSDLSSLEATWTGSNSQSEVED